MNRGEEIKSFIRKNKDKKIAFFVDMDGTIADLEVDKNNDIGRGTPGFFLGKRPLRTVIDLLAEVAEFPNVDLYILSACKYVSQTKEKRRWLKEHAPYFSEERQIYVVQELTDYSRQTKAKIKAQNIQRVVTENSYDLAVYLEDEYLMLKAAYKLVGEKLWCLHISNFIE